MCVGMVLDDWYVPMNFLALYITTSVTDDPPGLPSRPRSNVVAKPHTSCFCAAHSVAHSTSRAPVLPHSIYLAKGTGGRRPNLGCRTRGDVVRCDQRSDDVDIFVQGEKWCWSIHVVESTPVINLITSTSVVCRRNEWRKSRMDPQRERVTREGVYAKFVTGWIWTITSMFRSATH